MDKLLKLDLCCGPTKPEGFFGIDCIEFPGVDLVHDFNDDHFYVHLNMSRRPENKGPRRIIPLDDNTCEVIRAHDAIEHIADGYMLMKEIWRVGIDNALVDILVPSTDGRGAFQDQTHKSYYNQNSFGYWVNDAAWVDYYRGSCLFKYEELYTTSMSSDQVCHVVFKARIVKNAEWLKKYSDRQMSVRQQG
jgi:hypothetical protein